MAKALREVFISPNVPDSNYEAANLVDTTNYMANGLCSMALAIDKHAEAIKELADAIYQLERR